MKQNLVITIIIHKARSNLLSWETFGQELSVDEESPRDVWLIEITGGSGQDCENCVNYNFSNMTEFYVPALLSGVENYSDQHALQYVGFSNGCRAALSSLDRYDTSGKVNSGYYFDQNTGTYKAMNMSANLVREFIGVGCPGAWNDSTLISELVVAVGDKAIKQLESTNNLHFSIRDASDAACASIAGSGIDNYLCQTLASFFTGEDSSDAISIGLFRNYYEFMKNTNDVQPGQNVTLNKLTIIYGFTLLGSTRANDGVVSTLDSEEITSIVSASNKIRCPDYGETHNSLPDSEKTIDIIKIRLGNGTMPDNYLCVNS